MGSQGQEDHNDGTAAPNPLLDSSTEGPRRESLPQASSSNQLIAHSIVNILKPSEVKVTEGNVKNVQPLQAATADFSGVEDKGPENLCFKPPCNRDESALSWIERTPKSE